MTRSSEAQAARGTLRTNSPQGRRVPGESGVWVFIFGDLTVFAILFAVYLYHRAAQPALFDESQARLNQTFGVVNTFVLLTSSLFVVTAVRAVRRGGHPLARKLTCAAMACGAVFIANKVIEYSQEISRDLTPSTNQFFMYFYIMTGLHLLHVVMGLGLLWFVVKLTDRKSLTGREQGYLEGAGCFWHMVDLLWIVVFPLLYLVK